MNRSDGEWLMTLLVCITITMSSMAAYLLGRLQVYDGGCPVPLMTQGEVMELLEASDLSDEAKIALPDVVEYSRDVQNKAADELESYDVPTLAEFMKDYSVMRDQARRARGR